MSRLAVVAIIAAFAVPAASFAVARSTRPDGAPATSRAIVMPAKRVRPLAIPAIGRAENLPPLGAGAAATGSPASPIAAD